MELSPLELYILLHLKRAGVDYAKMIMKVTALDLNNITNAINSLEKKGLVERDYGSAIKRTKARFKKAKEVHKHHSYYKLSKSGSILVREINGDFLRDYFNSIMVNGYDFIKQLSLSNFEDICKDVNGDCKEIKNDLISMNFITQSGRKTKFFKIFCSFADI